MLERFYPKEWIDSAYDIPWEEWYENGLRGAIFDIDNTLVKDNAPADETARGLFLRLKKIGITPFLLSNNNEKRVEPFAKAVDCQYLCRAGKPGVKGYDKALEMMNTGRGDTVNIGDQIFTDTWGANRAGIYTVLTEPIDPREEFQIRLKRIPEKFILHFYKKAHAKKQWQTSDTDRGGIK